MSSDLRSKTIRLAHSQPRLRPLLLPLLKTSSYVLSFTLSTALEHDEGDAEREDGGSGVYSQAINDCLQSIEDALDGYNAAGYRLKVKFTTAKNGVFVARLEASNSLPFSRDTLERVISSSEKELLKQIQRVVDTNPQGEWVFGRGRWLIEENVL